MADNEEINPKSDLQEIERLRALVDAFTQLNTSLDLEKVLLNTLDTAGTLMNAEVGSIALINDEGTHLQFVESTDKNFDRLKNIEVPIGEGIAGSVATSGTPIRVKDVRADNRFYGIIDEKLGQRTQSYLCVPLFVDDKIIGTAQIMNRIDGKSFTLDDEKLMGGFARQAALAIHNAKMHSIMLKQKAIDSEMEVCAQIQKKLFPDNPPDISGYELFGSSVPCREVGGDYYSFIPRDDDFYDCIIADVSGKGLSASMMVSELHTGLHLLAQMDNNLEKTIQILDDHLMESLIIGKFVTMFALRLKSGFDRIDYVLAGHPSPIIVNPNGKSRQLERTGVVLGIPGTPNPTMGSFTMESGDVLISFSDGYSEATNPDEELYEEERIGELTMKYINHPLEEIRKRLDESVNEFTNSVPVPDDATLLLIRKK